MPGGPISSDVVRPQRRYRLSHRTSPVREHGAAWYGRQRLPIRTLRITACAKLSHEARLSTGALTVDAMDNSDASDTGNTPNADDAVETCNAKGCDLPATATCDRCERRFCAAHCAVLVLQRRDDSPGRPDHHGMLARLPMRTESYTLCAACRNKPVPRNLPPLTATQRTPQSTPKRSVPGAHDQDVINKWSEAWSADDE